MMLFIKSVTANNFFIFHLFLIAYRLPTWPSTCSSAGVIESKERSVGRVLAEISDSQENYDVTIELIANGIVFDPWVG